MEGSIEEIIEDATIDAYTIDEQLLGFYYKLDEEISFPLTILLLGNKYVVTEINEKCGRIKWVIDVNDDQKYLIDITDTRISDQSSYDFKLIQAYREWLNCK